MVGEDGTELYGEEVSLRGCADVVNDRGNVELLVGEDAVEAGVEIAADLILIGLTLEIFVLVLIERTELASNGDVGWESEDLGMAFVLRLVVGAAGDDGVESGVAGELLLLPVAGARLYLIDRLLRREWGLVWIRECRVSSSEREKRFVHPGKVHACGFSPVWVLMCRV